jgi:hypothetical protein
MTRPGARLRSIATRVFDPSTMEQLIDPVIADLQCEHADAMRRGHMWRARWIRVAGCIAFWKVVGLAAFAGDKPGARAIGVALSTALPLTALAICVALWNTPATIDSRGTQAWLVLCLVPQALAVSLPVCLGLGLFIWFRGEGADPSSRRTVLWLMRAALLLAVVNVGWIAPAANDAYRNVIARKAALRGANELTFIELGHRVYEGGPRGTGDPLPLTFWFNARLALAVAPVLLSVLALAGAAARRRGPSAAIVAVTLTVFAGCYLLFPAGDVAVLTRWLPAAAIAWVPNSLVMIATLSVAANQRAG